MSSVNSNALVLAVCYEERIRGNLFVEIGSKGKRRIISASKMATNIRREMSDTLPAPHAINGCDATSAFFGLGKKIYKVIKNSEDY